MTRKKELSSLPLSDELLQYYKQRVEKSENEYLEAIDLIEAVKPSQAAQHQSQWQINQFQVQVMDLQRALSDTQTALIEERKNVARLQTENDNLRIQEIKDKRKLRYLMNTGEGIGIGAPFEGKEPKLSAETTYFKDKLNKRMVIKRPRYEDAIPESAREKELRLRAEAHADQDVETLKLTIKALRAQLEDQLKLFDETVQVYKRDRSALLQGENERREKDQAKIQELLKKIEKLEEFNRENVKELVTLKRGLLTYERQTKEDRMRIISELNSAQSELQSEKGRNDTVQFDVEQRVKQQNEHTLMEMNKEMHRKQEELRISKQKEQTKYDSSIADYEKRIQALRHKVETQGSGYKALQIRREHEIEGFSNDIQILRKQLKALEKQILQYGPLEDKELQLLGMAQETGQKASKLTSELHTLKGQMYRTEQEIRGLAF